MENEKLTKGDGDIHGSESSSVSESSTSTDNEPATFEGVTAEQFTEAFTALDTRIDALIASSVVLVIALFACVGVMAVQTLLRSFEER